MCTVLITYSTPVPPTAVTTEVDDHAAEGTAGRESAAAPSVRSTTAGIDEAIAATVADELTRAGHRVACRPSVAVTTTNGFDLVVAVHGLRVSLWDSRTPRRVDPEDPERVEPAAASQGNDEGRPDDVSSIPLTWCADWRAVDAWARSVGDHLVHLLELRTELARVRAELERCRALLLVDAPEPRSISAPELGRATTWVAPHSPRHSHRLTPANQSPRS